TKRRERPVPQPDAGGRSRGDEGRGVEGSCSAGEGQGDRGSSPQELAGASVSGGHSDGRPEQAIHQDQRIVETGTSGGGQGGSIRHASGEDKVGERRRQRICLRGNPSGGAHLWSRCTTGQVGSRGCRG